jgi:hypothetical protein
MALDCDGFEIETLMNIRAVRAGLSIAEVPSYERPRIFGVSRLNAVKDGWRVLRTIARERLRSRRPYDNGSTAKASPVVVGTGRGSGST